MRNNAAQRRCEGRFQAVSLMRWVGGIAAVAMLSIGAAVQAGLTAKVRPNPVTVGEQAQFVITSTEGRVQPGPLPRISGLEWLGGPFVSQSIQIINFRQQSSYSVAYAFRVTRAGVWRIPPMTVTVKGRRQTTPEVRFTAIAAGAGAAGGGISIDRLVFVKVTAGSGPEPVPKRVYVGQEVPVRIQVYVMDRLWAGMEYPQLEVENAALHDFSKENPDNMRFRRPRQSIEQIDGMPFRVVTFECALTALSARPISGKGSVTCRLRFPRPRRRTPGFPGPFFDDFDDFFDDFFGQRRVIEKKVAFLLPKIPVAPLPPVPRDAGQFLGVLGDWRLQADVDTHESCVGDTVALQLTIEGRGSLDTLKAPKLDLPGFRVHPPEVKKEQHDGTARAQITWPIVPLEAGALLPELKFCTFDPKTGTYRSQSFKINLRVRPALTAETPSVVAEAPRSDASRLQARSERAPKQEPTDILYIKTKPGRYVLRPLWRNVVPAGFAPALVGLAVWFGCSWLAVRRERLAGDERAQRRHEALQERAAVLRELRACPPERRNTVICERLTPWLAAMLGLPPGTTPTELATHIEEKDPDLADILRRAEQQMFMPGGSAEVDVRDLLRRLRRIGVALFCGALFVLSTYAPTLRAAEEPTPKSTGAPAAAAKRSVSPSTDGQPAGPQRPADFAAGVKAYEQGRIEEALAIFEALERPGAENAALLYNCGNCYFRLGRFGDAVAAYERARRIAPRDDDILENLNFVRNRLGFPPVSVVRTPGDLLMRVRDYLRPDEWLWLAAWSALFIGVWAGVRRLRGRRPVTAFRVLAGIVLLSALCSWSQWHGPWQPDLYAVVVSVRAVPHLAPGENADKAGFNLRVGEVVQVQERRPKWLRIRKGEAEGWVESRFLRIVW